jgi:hypothetical protein
LASDPKIFNLGMVIGKVIVPWVSLVDAWNGEYFSIPGAAVSKMDSVLSDYGIPIEGEIKSYSELAKKWENEIPQDQISRYGSWVAQERVPEWYSAIEAGWVSCPLDLKAEVNQSYFVREAIQLSVTLSCVPIYDLSFPKQPRILDAIFITFSDPSVVPKDLFAIQFGGMRWSYRKESGDYPCDERSGMQA